MSEQHTTPTDYDAWVEEPDELPPRPRRRWVTPLTGTLLGALLVACGFVAGVLVEKGQGSSSATGAAGFRRGAGGGGAGVGGFGQAAARAGATIGQVSSLQGRTLYVTTTDGGTVQVDVPPGETVTRTTSAGVRDVHPGDTVVIQGSHVGDGAIEATSVRATAADAFGGGGGGGGASLNQLFGGR